MGLLVLRSMHAACESTAPACACWTMLLVGECSQYLYLASATQIPLQVDRAPSHTCRRSQAILGNMYRAPQLGIEMEQRLQVLRFCSA